MLTKQTCPKCGADATRMDHSGKVAEWACGSMIGVGRYGAGGGQFNQSGRGVDAARGAK